MMATSSLKKVAILMHFRNNFALKQGIRQLKVKYLQIYAKSNAKILVSSTASSSSRKVSDYTLYTDK